MRARRDHSLKAMPEPWPAKTKMRVEMNSANAALRAPGWYTSWWLPTAILLIGIFTAWPLALTTGGGEDSAWG